MSSLWLITWGGKSLWYSCQNSFIGTAFGSLQIAPISSYLLAAGLLQEIQYRWFTCAMSPCISHSLHFLPTHSEIILVPHSAAQTTFGFLPGTHWTPCRGGAASVFVCVLAREVCKGKMHGKQITKGFLLLHAAHSFILKFWFFATGTLLSLRWHNELREFK